MEDISLSGVTTTESITSGGGGELNTILESAEVHQEDEKSEMSLPLPPSEDELKTTSEMRKPDSGGGYRDNTVYADLNFEDFERASKVSLKLNNNT